MAITLLSTEVPIPTGPSAGAVIADCTDSTTTAPTETAFATGDRLGVSEHLNEVLASLANTGGFGGNGYGIQDGLTLASGVGLVLPIAAGRAQILGTVEYAGGSKVLPDDTALIRIWLKQDGTIEALTNLDPPVGAEAILLGTCTTSGGAITMADDVSGVCYIRGGLIWRETADAGAPEDTPDSHTVFLTRTQGGLYLWDGSQYVTLESSDQGSTPLTFEFTTAGNHTWTKPTTGNYKMARIICIGGGGGGGSGRKGAAATPRAGGGGGTGGALSIRDIPLSLLGATEDVAVGAGGAGGAAITAASGSGNNGTAGGASLFGTAPNAWVRAGGGLGGNGGAAGNTFAVLGSMGSHQSASSGSVASAVSTGPANSPGGAGSGGTGGSITNADVPSAGTQGGGNGTVVGNATSLATSAYVGGAGGAVDNPGTAGASMVGVGLEPGPGGGGGGASISAAGRIGGAGGRYGGGGGGGGASLGTAGDSGAGGAGADGAVFVIVY